MVNTATVGPRLQQLIITDTSRNRRYIVDTGAQVSVILASYIDRRSVATTGPLQANGSSIASLYFCGRVYSVRLVIADVRRPLLGTDFLREHNLLVDLKGQRLIEGSTFSPTICNAGIAADHDLALLDSTRNKFRKILGEFPDLLPPNFSSSTVPHGVQHYITTSGPHHMIEHVVYPLTN